MRTLIIVVRRVEVGGMTHADFYLYHFFGGSNGSYLQAKLAGCDLQLEFNRSLVL